MNMRVAEKLEPGALVRQSWDTVATMPKLGLVIGKTYVEEVHEAKIIGGYKGSRYDIVVHWFKANRLEVLQNWEIMVMESVEPSAPAEKKVHW